MHFQEGPDCRRSRGFWSLTMYDDELLLRRQPAQPLFDQRAAAPEGQCRRLVDLYLQKDSPGADKESNWLPAPAGKSHPDAAALLAGRRRSVDHRRVVGHSAGQACKLRRTAVETDPVPPCVRAREGSHVERLFAAHRRGACALNGQFAGGQQSLSVGASAETSLFGGRNNEIVLVPPPEDRPELRRRLAEMPRRAEA